MSTESPDLADGYAVLENPEEWFVCPHCGCDDVDVKNLNGQNDLRPVVSCPDCGASGYLSPYTPHQPPRE